MCVLDTVQNIEYVLCVLWKRCSERIEQILCLSMKVAGNFVHSLSSLLGMYPCILFLRIEETGNKTI